MYGAEKRSRRKSNVPSRYREGVDENTIEEVIYDKIPRKRKVLPKTDHNIDRNIPKKYKY